MLNSGFENEIRKLASSEPTPFYLYSVSAIRSRIQELSRAFRGEVDIFYSAKANSHPRILTVMKENGVLVDVASMGELERAIAIGFSPEQISFTGPGKRREEIARAVELGVGAMVLESFDELEEIEAHAARIGRMANVAPRLTPSRRLGHTGRLVVGEPTQFGFDESNFDDLAKRFGSLRFVRIVGTHSHVQSQMLNHEHVLGNLEFALETSLRFQSKLQNVKVGEFFRMCLGGGFGIPYTASAAPLNLGLLASQFEQLVKGCPSAGPGGVRYRFALELGRYLVGESGCFVARLLSKKVARSAERTVHYAVADGGYSQCQIACGVGQVIRTNLPFTVLKRDGGERERGDVIVSIAGPTCHSQDIVVREASMDGIDVGDILVVQNVGAYGKQFSPAEFLLMPEAGQHFMESR